MLGWILVIIGVIFMIVGAATQSPVPYVLAFVAFFSGWLYLSIRMVRNRRQIRASLRVAGEPKIESSAKRSEEAAPSKNLDYIEQLKKLAQLRDAGILTQEEFEQKKTKILKDSG